MIEDANFLHYFTMPWFWSSFLAWTLAQMIKMTTGAIKTHSLDFRYLLSTGGMPSAHSAMVCGLAASIGLTEGFDSAVAMLAAGFAAITMFDAATVRRAAGLQARVMNQLVAEFFKEHKLRPQHLKELLGHTRKEVAAGMVTGIVVAIIVTYFWPA